MRPRNTKLLWNVAPDENSSHGPGLIALIKISIKSDNFTSLLFTNPYAHDFTISIVSQFEEKKIEKLAVLVIYKLIFPLLHK